MSKHTQSPWVTYPRLSGSENHRGYIVRGNDKFIVADVVPRDQDGIVGGANARLIAAAPELLEALTAICDELLGDDEFSAKQIARHAGRKAIAKATGEQA